MSFIKTAKLRIALDPEAESSKTFIKLLTALEPDSKSSFDMAEMFRLEDDDLILALAILHEWRIAAQEASLRREFNVGRFPKFILRRSSKGGRWRSRSAVVIAGLPVLTSAACVPLLNLTRSSQSLLTMGAAVTSMLVMFILRGRWELHSSLLRRQLANTSASSRRLERLQLFDGFDETDLEQIARLHIRMLTRARRRRETSRSSEVSHEVDSSGNGSAKLESWNVPDQISTSGSL